MDAYLGNHGLQAQLLLLLLLLPLLSPIGLVTFTDDSMRRAVTI